MTILSGGSPESTDAEGNFEDTREEDDLMDLICDVVGTIPSPYMHSNDLDMNGMEVDADAGTYQSRDTNQDNGRDRAQESGEGDRLSANTASRPLHTPGMPPPPATGNADPISAFLSLPNAKRDDSFNTVDIGSQSRSHRSDSEAGGDSSNSSNRLFNKYETQPVHMLRKKIQTIEMEKNRCRYRCI
jgi:hypothetical protein